MRVDVTEAVMLSVREAVETPCDIGRVWDIDYGGDEESACPWKADWSALAHDCHLGRPILLCSKHLAACRNDYWPEQFIKWDCERCGMVAVSMDSVIWNVRRL